MRAASGSGRTSSTGCRNGLRARVSSSPAARPPRVRSGSMAARSEGPPSMRARSAGRAGGFYLTQPSGPGTIPNDGSHIGGAIGGGRSAYFAKPSFQKGFGPVNNWRSQPDVASIASPKFPASFINSRIYRIAGAGQSNAGFYDVTTGNKTFNHVSGFNAATGYDLATGWGTVDIARFVSAYTQSDARSSASVAMSRTSLRFGKTRVGSRKQKTVTLTNSASKKSGESVIFSGGSISGSPAFSLSTTCTGTVAPKQKCSATLSFAPTAPGAQTATVTITSNGSNGPNHTFTVSGTGK